MAFFCSSHGRIPYTDTVQGHEVLIFMHGRPTSKELFEPLLQEINSLSKEGIEL